jgi:hypothetical protein
MAKIVMGVAMIAGAVLLAPVNPALALKLGVMGVSTTISGIAEETRGGQANSFSTKQPAASWQIVYGQTRVNGTIAFQNTGGNKGIHALHQVVIWAAHPCKSLEQVYIDGKLATFTNGTTGYVLGGWRTDDAGNKYRWGADTIGTYIEHQWWYGGYEGYNLQLSSPGDHLPQWDSTCTLNGLCASYLRTNYTSESFSGIPTLKVNLHGKCDIYDPRLGAQYLGDGVTPNPATHVWTDNAALCIADFLTNTEYGVGCTWTEIDIDQLIAAANICDELVPLASGSQSSQWQANKTYVVGQVITDSNGKKQTVVGYTGSYTGNPTSGSSHPSWSTTLNGFTNDHNIVWQCGGIATAVPGYEKRYTINGSFQASTTPGDILDSMLMSMEGRISYCGGKWRIIPAAWYGSGLSFDENDIIGSVKWTPKRKLRDLNNAVRATYVSPVYPYTETTSNPNIKHDGVWSGQYQPCDAPEYAQDAAHGYASDVNLAADNGVKLYGDRRYQFVQSVATVQRLMKIYLLRNRQQGSGTLTMKLGAYKAVAQDVIQVSFPTLGWDNKNLEVWSTRFVTKADSNKEGEAPTMYVEMDVVETDPSVYTWSTAEERGMEDTPSPALAAAVDAPSNLQLTSGSATAVVGTDGVVIPRILATWNQPDDPFVTTGGKITVQIQKVGDGTENLIPATEDFTDPNWLIASTCTVTADTVAAPDASTTADTLSFPAKAANTTCGFHQDTLVTAQSQDMVFSVYLKAATTCQVELVIEDHPYTTGNSTIVTVNNTWQRYQVTANLNTTNGLTVWVRSPWGSALGAYSVYAWGAQLEHGTTASAYTDIPDGNWQTAATLAGTATRCYISGVVCGQQYNARIRSVRASGKTSDWLAVGSHTVSTTASSFTSSVLNNQGSIVPNQAIPLTVTYTSSSITVSVSSMSLLRPDGSTLSIGAGSKTYSGLASSTTYYIYPYIEVATGTLKFTNPDPPQTSPSTLLAAQRSLDGRIAVNLVAQATAASGNPGGGGTGGDPTCPEAAELVEEKTKGVIAAKDVEVGDYLKGKCFTTGEDVYRRVIQTSSVPASVWRMVDGHRVSPCEAIWHEGTWKPAYQASGATVDRFNGIRINISLDSDEHDEQNYYLADGTPLLIHNNVALPAC